MHHLPFYRPNLLIAIRLTGPHLQPPGGPIAFHQIGMGVAAPEGVGHGTRGTSAPSVLGRSPLLPKVTRRGVASVQVDGRGDSAAEGARQGAAATEGPG